jgi:hypothetical protein
LIFNGLYGVNNTRYNSSGNYVVRGRAFFWVNLLLLHHFLKEIEERKKVVLRIADNMNEINIGWNKTGRKKATSVA